MSTIDIHQEALLVSLHTSMWTARKYDKKVTDKVNKDHGASADAGRFNKHLLPGDNGDNETYQYLVKYMGYIRRKHYELTLDWDEGRQLLPHANHAAYREFEADVKGEVANVLYPAFRAAYPEMKEQARRLLNGMFVEADYPSLSEMDKKFGVTIDFSPVPKMDYRSSHLAKPLIEKMEREHEAREARLIDTAMGDAWQRLYTCVESLQERLSTPNAVFRNSLIENLRECCDVLGRLNVMKDPSLERMRSAALTNIARYEPDALREDDQTRGVVARTAADLMTEIRGTRRIRTAAEMRAA